MKEKFTKDDLKPGMVVMNRAGVLYIVFATSDGTKILLNKKFSQNLDYFSDDLKHFRAIETPGDIIKVYQVTEKCTRLNDIFNLDLLELIWLRKDSFTLDFDEVAKRLGIDADYLSIKMPDGAKISKR